FPWVKGPLSNILERAEKDLVLVDFETDWCKWCKVLDENTYPDPEVIKFARKNMVGFKIDAEKGAGINLARKYNVTGFPTLVIMDNDGREIDRIIGYMPPEPFLKELKRIKNGVETIKALELRVEKNPGQELSISNLAEKYENAGYFEKASKLWLEVITINGSIKSRAEFRLVILDFKKNSSLKTMEDYLAGRPEPVYAQQAFSTIISYFKKEKNQKMEMEYLLKKINNAEEFNLETPALLNSFSWRITELEASDNYEFALLKVRQAISMLGADEREALVGIMDTEAEVLWKMDRIEEAAAVIDEALVLSPDDEYLFKQKEKFIRK
ncbi:MAG: thioredoxin family protein, partial [Candidatus Neomarinimicrobiota bacterium]